MRNALDSKLGDTEKSMTSEIHFVTGKGGVGKSTVAAALALKKAKAGLRTLLVEIGDQSFYKDYFELPQVGFEPVKIQENFSVALWTGQSCLREYIIHLIKVESLYRLFFENAVMKAFVNVAPALPELAIMGKATSGPRHHGPALPFDCIVMDCYATGHFMALMGAAEGMAKAVKYGPMGDQSRSIDAMLRNPEVCHYYLVCLPEELPIKETEELHEELEKHFGVKAKVVLNKYLEGEIPTGEYTAAKKGESEEFREFAREDQKTRHIHREMKTRLQKLDPKLQTLPSIWEHQVPKLLAQLSERLV
ncbi:ArsA-related P-loop ATPase [Bdellovibrio sp. HCB337]|uniref:ArsA-related P-loop ATPase n=1 Tax=Bdellovibrio sp. HCB337 TaxID=3394358 RepID=UPI0039A511E4